MPDIRLPIQQVLQTGYHQNETFIPTIRHGFTDPNTWHQFNLSVSFTNLNRPKTSHNNKTKNQPTLVKKKWYYFTRVVGSDWNHLRYRSPFWTCLGSRVCQCSSNEERAQTVSVHNVVFKSSHVDRNSETRRRLHSVLYMLI